MTRSSLTSCIPPKGTCMTKAIISTPIKEAKLAKLVPTILPKMIVNLEIGETYNSCVKFISRTSAYHLVNDPPFPVLRIGNALRIPKEAFDRWLMGA